MSNKSYTYKKHKISKKNEKKLKKKPVFHHANFFMCHKKVPFAKPQPSQQLLNYK